MHLPFFRLLHLLLFKNAPAERLAQKLREHNLQQMHAEWVSSYICLLIFTDEQVVLLDTGAGGLGPNTGRLLQRLKAVGNSSRKN